MQVIILTLTDKATSAKQSWVCLENDQEIEMQIPIWKMHVHHVTTTSICISTQII